VIRVIGDPLVGLGVSPMRSMRSPGITTDKSASVYKFNPPARKTGLNEAGRCLSVEQQAAVAELMLGHKEGGSCDPFTQEDALRALPPQLFRGHDPSPSASSPTVRRTLWKISRQVRAR
jgi:hypothetical protein